MNVSVELSRRNFLQAVGVLGLGAVSCAPLLKRARLAHAVLNQPHPDDYQPVLRSLMGAVLPFEDPAFPKVPLGEVEAILNLHFPLTAPGLRSFQWALLIFNQMDLFAEDLSPVIEEEEKRLKTFDNLDQRSIAKAVQQLSADEITLYEGFAREHRPEGLFKTAPLQLQRAYFSLWARSNFTIKRQFYSGARSIILAAAYSLPELWESIGYDGPIKGTPDEG